MQSVYDVMVVVELGLMVEGHSLELLLLFYLTELELLLLLEQYISHVHVFILDVFYYDMAVALLLKLDTLETPGGQLPLQLGGRVLVIFLVVEYLRESLLVVLHALPPHLVDTSPPTPHAQLLELLVWVVHQELQVVLLEVIRLLVQQHVLHLLVIFL